MTDSPHDVDADDGNQDKKGLAPWQRVVGIIGLLVVLVIVIALLVGGGHTSPVQHGAA